MGNCEKQSYHENKQHAPQQNYAKISTTKPVLLEQVKRTIQQEFSECNNLVKLRKIKRRKIKRRNILVYYEGEWFNGKPCGKGKIYFQNGSYFEGYFKDGDANCEDGILIYPDGSFKRGQLRKSKFDGYGKFNYKQGSLIYKGQWKNNKPHGKGIQKYEDGNQYEGFFHEGKKQGNECQFRWKNGKRYYGPFQNGYMNGKGVLTYKQQKYEGFFKNNLKVDNYAILTTQRGVYQGPFQNDQMNGIGQFRWKDKKIYKGQFKNGKLHGNGIIQYPNGQKAQGEWINGQNNMLQKIKQ